MPDQLSSKEIANKIRPYVTATENKIRPYINQNKIEFTLTIDVPRIRLERGYWRIPIRPSREPYPLFAYYESLAELEDLIQQNLDMKVSIASGSPLEEELA